MDLTYDVDVDVESSRQFATDGCNGERAEQQHIRRHTMTVPCDNVEEWQPIASSVALLGNEMQSATDPFCMVVVH